MRSIGLGTVLITLTLTAVARISAIAMPTEQVNLLVLTDSNTLIRFNTNHLSETEQIKVSGVSGSLLGIDYRPANGRSTASPMPITFTPLTQPPGWPL
jgi:hypothetical protein